jgi:hypothetical protein
MIKRITQTTVARLCGVNQATVSRILSRKEDKFSEETSARILQVARETGYLHPALLSSDRRGSPRRRVSIALAVRIVTPDGRIHGRGTAESENVSMSGMLLRSIRTDTNALPLEPFCVDLEASTSRRKTVRIRSRPVRLDEETGNLTIAVRYDPLSEGSRRFLSDRLQHAARA